MSEQADVLEAAEAWYQACGVEDDPYAASGGPELNRLYHALERLQAMRGTLKCGTDDRGDWTLAASGRRFWPMDPRPEDVHLDDTAHSLALQNRYLGHLPWGPYNVAHHSVLVAMCVAETHPEKALAALFHDAPEANVGDVIRPLKRSGALTATWYEAERRWEECYAEVIGFDVADLRSDVVKTADVRLLLAEKRDLLNANVEGWKWKEMDKNYKPWEPKITPLGWLESKSLFLTMVESLRRGRR